MWRVGGRPNGDVGRFEACRSRGLKLNADKSKVMVLNGENGWEREIRGDMI